MAKFRRAEMALDITSNRLAIVTTNPNRYQYIDELNLFAPSHETSGLTLSSTGVVPDSTTQRIEFADGTRTAATRPRVDFEAGEGVEIGIVDDATNNQAKVSIGAEALARKFRLLLTHYVQTLGVVPDGLEDDWARALQEG